MTTVAERLTARGLKQITLPASGETVTIRRPKTRDLMRIGLFPLTVSRLDLKEMDPDEKEALLKEAERSAIRFICECSHEPKIVQRTPKPGEVHIDALETDDFAYYHEQALEFAVEEKPEPPTKNHPKAEDNFELLAKACATFGIDPTEAELWPDDRAKRLIDYALLAVKKHGN